MKLEKAIEILSSPTARAGIEGIVEFEDAVSLGIEALKRLKEHREDHIEIIFRALPGETKD